MRAEADFPQAKRSMGNASLDFFLIVDDPVEIRQHMPRDSRPHESDLRQLPPLARLQELDIPEVEATAR